MRKRTPPRRTSTKPAIGPIETFAVTGLTHEAKGVARHQGKVTFIADALPGETVAARVTKPGRRFDEAQLQQIITPSPHRVEPACQHYAQCGGCSFQHLSDDQQLVAKMDWLQGQLRKVWQQPIAQLTDSSRHYRRRARIALQVKGGKALMGFRQKASKDIVEIDRCLVLTERLQEIYSVLKPALLKDDMASRIGHVELLEDSRGASVLFRLTATVPAATQESWQNWAQTLGVELYWQAPEESRVNVVAEKMRHYVIEQQTLTYHPQDFIQVNARMNEKMIDQALNWLQADKNDVILDLFCGVGNFSLPLARQAKSVVGVEVQPSMVAAAQANAECNNLENIRFVAADLSQPVGPKFTKLGVTKVLLDPPRAGAFEFLDSLVKISPQQILYVSCNASTLARDAEYLVAHGYQVVKVGLMEMFPQTSHIETMMLLQKKK